MNMRGLIKWFSMAAIVVALILSPLAGNLAQAGEGNGDGSGGGPEQPPDDREFDPRQRGYRGKQPGVHQDSF